MLQQPQPWMGPQWYGPPQEPQPLPQRPPPTRFMSVEDAMNSALSGSSRVRPRPHATTTIYASPGMADAQYAPQPMPPGPPMAGQHPYPAAPPPGAPQSMAAAALASLPPHLQASLVPPPLDGVDPICGPLYAKPIPPNVLAITVHKSDEFRPDTMLTNPVVRLHVLDPVTGDYMRSLMTTNIPLDPSAQDMMLRYPGRPSTLTLANNSQPTPALQEYLPPVQTAPYNMVRRAAPAASAVWGETLLVDEALERLVALDALLMFEILQLPVSFHRYCKHPDKFPAGTHRVSWAFLRLSRPDVTAVTPQSPPPFQPGMEQPLPQRKLLVGDLKLQLYRYRSESALLGSRRDVTRAEEKLASAPTRAFTAWKALTSTGAAGNGLLGPLVDKYPAALHITLEALARPIPAVVKIDPSRNLRAVLPAGYGSGFEEGSVPMMQFMLQTFGTGAGGLGGAGLLGGGMAQAIEKSPWYRSRGEPCRLPNRKWRALVTGPGGACCAAFSTDGGRVAVAAGEGARVDNFHILLYSAVTGADLARLHCAHKGWVHTLSWSSDDKALLSASSDNTAKVWEMALFHAASKTLRPRTLRHSCHVYSAVFHPQQATHPLIMTAGKDGAIYAWHRYSGQALASLLPDTCPPSLLLPPPPLPQPAGAAAAAAAATGCADTSATGGPAACGGAAGGGPAAAGCSGRVAAAVGGGGGGGKGQLGELSGCINVLAFDTLGTRLWAGDENGTVQEFAVDSGAIQAAIKRVLAGLPPGAPPGWDGACAPAPGPGHPGHPNYPGQPFAHPGMPGHYDPTQGRGGPMPPAMDYAPHADGAAPPWINPAFGPDGPWPGDPWAPGMGYERGGPPPLPGPLQVATEAPLLPPSVLWQWVPEIGHDRVPPPPPPPMYPASPDALSQTVVHQQRVTSGGGAPPGMEGPSPPGPFLDPFPRHSGGGAVPPGAGPGQGVQGPQGPGPYLNPFPPGGAGSPPGGRQQPTSYQQAPPPQQPPYQQGSPPQQPPYQQGPPPQQPPYQPAPPPQQPPYLQTLPPQQPPYQQIPPPQQPPYQQTPPPQQPPYQQSPPPQQPPYHQGPPPQQPPSKPQPGAMYIGGSAAPVAPTTGPLGAPPGPPAWQPQGVFLPSPGGPPVGPVGGLPGPQMWQQPPLPPQQQQQAGRLGGGRGPGPIAEANEQQGYLQAAPPPLQQQYQQPPYQVQQQQPPDQGQQQPPYQGQQQSPYQGQHQQQPYQEQQPPYQVQQQQPPYQGQHQQQPYQEQQPPYQAQQQPYQEQQPPYQGQQQPPYQGQQQPPYQGQQQPPYQAQQQPPYQGQQQQSPYPEPPPPYQAVAYPILRDPFPEHQYSPTPGTPPPQYGPTHATTPPGYGGPYDPHNQQGYGPGSPPPGMGYGPPPPSDGYGPPPPGCGPAGSPPVPAPPPPGPLLRAMRSCGALAGEPLASLSLHPTGRKLLALTRCSRLVTIDTRAFNTPRPLGRVRCQHALVKAACSPDGAYVLAGGEDGAVRAYDGQAAVGMDVAQVALPHLALGPSGGAHKPVHCVAWNPHLHMVAVCGWGSWSPLLLAVWDKTRPAPQLGVEGRSDHNKHAMLSRSQTMPTSTKVYELPDKLTPALVHALLADVRLDAHKRGVLTSPAKSMPAYSPPGSPMPIFLSTAATETGAYGRPTPHPCVDQLVVLKPEDVPAEVLRLQKERAEKEAQRLEEAARLADRLSFPVSPPQPSVVPTLAPSPAPAPTITLSPGPTIPTPAGIAAPAGPGMGAAATGAGFPLPAGVYAPGAMEGTDGPASARGAAAGGVADAVRAPRPDPELPPGVRTSTATYTPDLKGPVAGGPIGHAGEAALLKGEAPAQRGAAAGTGGASPTRSGPRPLHELPGMAQTGFSAALPPQQQFRDPIMAGPGATVVVGPGAVVYAHEGATVVPVVDPLLGHVPNVSQRPYELTLNQPMPVAAASGGGGGVGGVAAAAAAGARSTQAGTPAIIADPRGTQTGSTGAAGVPQTSSSTPSVVAGSASRELPAVATAAGSGAAGLVAAGGGGVAGTGGAPVVPAAATVAGVGVASGAAGISAGGVDAKATGQAAAVVLQAASPPPAGGAVAAPVATARPVDGGASPPIATAKPGEGAGAFKAPGSPDIGKGPATPTPATAGAPPSAAAAAGKAVQPVAAAVAAAGSPGDKPAATMQAKVGDTKLQDPAPSKPAAATGLAAATGQPAIASPDKATAAAAAAPAAATSKLPVGAPDADAKAASASATAADAKAGSTSVIAPAAPSTSAGGVSKPAVAPPPGLTPVAPGASLTGSGSPAAPPPPGLTLVPPGSSLGGSPSSSSAPGSGSLASRSETVPTIGREISPAVAAPGAAKPALATTIAGIAAEKDKAFPFAKGARVAAPHDDDDF